MQEKRRDKMRWQFKSALESLVSALSVGYSAEHAFWEAKKELHMLFGSESELYQEFLALEEQVRRNKNIEMVFYQFAMRTDIEEIRNFAEGFLLAKRSGGDLIVMLKKISERIQERLRIQEEIQILIRAKRLEQRALMIILPSILIYFQLFSPEFLSVLYHNSFGRVFMTSILVLYLLIIQWANRMMNIRF
ncbi:hypothetical protein FACS189418_8260 [Clostridia bacterium]|nr:hypothetical protein FACS189418_8260 [Clostridia bacterium]